MVAHPHLSLASGAIKGWDRRNQFYFQMLTSLAAHFGFDVEAPFDSMPQTAQDIVLYGSKEKIAFSYLSERGRTVVREHDFEGVIPNLERRYRETDSIVVREELAKYLNSKPCPACEGTRLRTRGAQRQDRRHADFRSERHAAQARPRVLPGPEARPGTKRRSPTSIVKEIASRLSFLNNVGLDYLSLDRAADTLSGGEAQRIRLASQIGSGLTGVMYVLDEPSIGLHQRDNGRLLATLKHLRDLGNTRDRGRARRRGDPFAPTTWSTWARARASTAASVVAEGTPQEIMLQPGFAHRPLSLGAHANPAAPSAATATTRHACCASWAPAATTSST